MYSGKAVRKEAKSGSALRWCCRIRMGLYLQRGNGHFKQEGKNGNEIPPDSSRRDEWRLNTPCFADADALAARNPSGKNTFRPLSPLSQEFWKKCAKSCLVSRANRDGKNRGPASALAVGPATANALVDRSSQPITR